MPCTAVAERRACACDAAPCRCRPCFPVPLPPASCQDKHVYPEAPTSTKAVLIKTALDQLVWGPAMTLVFFGG